MTFDDGVFSLAARELFTASQKESAERVAFRLNHEKWGNRSDCVVVPVTVEKQGE